MKSRQKSIALLSFLAVLAGGLLGVLGNHIELDIPLFWQPFVVPFFLFALVATGVAAVWQWKYAENDEHVSRDPQHPAGTASTTDPYHRYEIGIETLLQRLGTNHPRYNDALTYEQRLRENSDLVRTEGDTDTRRADRNAILRNLNSLAHDTLGTSFNALCPASVSHLSDLDCRNRTRMLEHVHDDWIVGILEQSLYREMLIDLGMEYNPDAVQYPWDMVLHRPDRADTTLPANTKMIEVFEQAKHELLILGAPGSGKTTMLLDLARTLIEQAQQDETLPIPVVFTFSTWAAFVEQQKKQPATLANWLVEELRLRYTVPKKIAQVLVEQNQILPLLDGLDEVKQQHRASCVAAINAYREQRGFALPGLVVCSRIADYQELQELLTLREAITLQPLSEQQIDDYLAQAGDEIAAVRTLLHDDADMRELADTPLMLSILVLAYKGVPVETLPDTGTLDEHRTHLFDRYVQQMFKRRGKEKRYSDEKTVQWLSWLAARMVEHGETVFYLERMQLTWLGDGWQRWVYRSVRGLYFGVLGGLIVGLSCGVLGGVLVGLLGGVGANMRGRMLAGLIGGLIFGLEGGLIFGLIIGLIFGLIIGLSDLPDDIKETKSLQWSWDNAGVGLFLGGFGGFILGNLFGLLLLDLYVGMLGVWSIMLLGVLLFGLLGGLLGGLSGKTVQLKTYPNEGIWNSLQSALISGLLSGLLGGLIGGLIIGLLFNLIGGLLFGLRIGLVIGLLFGLSIGLLNGGTTFILHFTIRAILVLNKTIPFNLIPFLDYAKERILLRQVGSGYVFVHRMLLEYFAERAHNRAVELAPKDALVYRKRGDFYTTLGRYEQAIDDYTSAIERKTKDADTFFRRGELLWIQDDYPQAIDDLKQVYYLLPKNHIVCNLLCWYGSLAGFADDGMVKEACNKAVQLKTQTGEYYDSRGINLAMRGYYAGAIVDFQAFITCEEKENPNNIYEIEQRKAWIEALQRGKNPFDDATLAELCKEIW